MCEQAAEAHKSKGVTHSSRRSRASTESGQMSKSSFDAILSNSGSTLFSQVTFFPVFSTGLHILFQIVCCLQFSQAYMSECV